VRAETLTKAPWGMPTAIHIDGSNWGFTSAGAISLWVVLDEVSETNGCLFFMPGSHTDAELGGEDDRDGDGGLMTRNINAIFQSDYPEWSEREMVPMLLNAGDATFRKRRIPWRSVLLLARRLRHDGACRRGEHDSQAAPRDDMCLHARRLHVQRQEEYPPGCVPRRH
jgi:hypothetical protein